MPSPSLIDMMNRTGPTMAEKPKKWRPKKSEEEAPKEEPRRMARIYANKAKKSGKPVERKEGGRRSLYSKMGM